MTHKTRTIFAAVLIAVIAAGVAAFALLHNPAEPVRVPPVVKFEEADLRYTYHVVTGADGLFDLAADPKCLKNLAAARPADTARLRAALAKRLGVADLIELQMESAEIIEKLNALGYY